ncbi:dnaJ homolog subfamily C member 25-like isoform X2 [Halichondria panicea]|uniref:dnaJ homolog subfamily C member 25-like isoform X2 n=1 Tax=Halichondria panicea TaxID=6063 RepID=UPI00312B61E4
MKTLTVLLVSCALSALFSSAAGLLEGLYCGRESCYDVLQVDKDVTAAEMMRAYRHLALEYHPDKNKVTEGELAEGSRERFQLISTTYEILKDEEERANYDYMLENPEQVYRHYYHYDHRRGTSQVDIRVIVGVAISVICLVQYLGWWHSYNTAITAALSECQGTRCACNYESVPALQGEMGEIINFQQTLSVYAHDSCCH